MPEFPEVHTISQDLNKNITGYEIKNIQISKNYKIPKSELHRLNSIKGEKILNVDQIAKNIVIKVSGESFLIFHLAMTGRILLREEKDIKDNWVKVVFEISKGHNTRYLKFCDMRQFGKIRVVNSTELVEINKKYGLNILDPKITAENLLDTIKSKRTNIKNVLLDQSIVSGLGNIYVTDSLFLSNINPKTSTQNLDLEDAKKLLKSIRDILNEGIKNRGSTLPDKMYVDIFGRSGSQQNYFKIYGKKKCSVCGGDVSFEKINGRGTYFCPTCQPLKNKNFKNIKIIKGQEKLF